MTIGIYLAVGVAILLIVVVLVVGRGAGAEVRKSIYEQMQVSVELSKGDVSARKDAVIRLDTLLGKSLEYAGVRGETVGERLKNAKHLFDRGKYDEIWKAHKVRNALVHEQHDISSKEARRVVSVFSSAIRRLLK
jgi:hypothetical protein